VSVLRTRNPVAGAEVTRRKPVQVVVNNIPAFGTV
jgi:hypothetical protein